MLQEWKKGRNLGGTDESVTPVRELTTEREEPFPFPVTEDSHSFSSPNLES